MIKNPWFRMYNEFIFDEKVEFLAFEDQRHYIFILCMKNLGLLDKEYPQEGMLEQVIAKRLGIQAEALLYAKERLIEVGLLDDNWQPVAWNKRQFKSDSSTERVRNHRKNKQSSNSDETLQKRKSNALDTDTDTDTEKKNKQKEKFKKPTVEEISEYCSERENGLNANQIFDHYEANGWRRGSTKIKDWRACVRTWEKNRKPIENSNPYEEFVR